MIEYFSGLVPQYGTLNGRLSDTELGNMLLKNSPPHYNTYKTVVRREAIKENDGKFELENLIVDGKISDAEAFTSGRRITKFRNNQKLHEKKHNITDNDLENQTRDLYM